MPIPSSPYSNESWDQRHFAIKIFHAIFNFVGELHRHKGTAKKLSEKMDNWLEEIKQSSADLFDKVIVVDQSINPQQIYPKVAASLSKYVRSTETGYSQAYLSLSDEDWLPLKKIVLGEWNATEVTEANKQSIRVILNANIPSSGHFVDKHAALLKALFYQGRESNLDSTTKYKPKKDYREDIIGLMDLAFQLMALAATPIELAEEDVKQDKQLCHDWEEAFKLVLGEIYEEKKEFEKESSSKDEFIEQNLHLTKSNKHGYFNLSPALQGALGEFKKSYPKAITRGSQVTVDIGTKLSYLNTGIIGTLSKLIEERNKHAKTKSLSDEQAHILNYWGQFSTQYKLYEKTSKMKLAYEKIEHCKLQIKQLTLTVSGVYEHADTTLTGIREELFKAYDDLISLQDSPPEKEKARLDKESALRELEDAKEIIYQQQKRAIDAKDDKALLTWYEETTDRLRETITTRFGEEVTKQEKIESMHLGELHALFQRLTTEAELKFKKALSELDVAYEGMSRSKDLFETRLRDEQASFSSFQVEHDKFNHDLINQIQGWDKVAGVSYPDVPADLSQYDTPSLFRLYWSLWHADYAALEKKITQFSKSNAQLEERNKALASKLMGQEKEHATQVDDLSHELNALKVSAQRQHLEIETLQLRLKEMLALQAENKTLSLSLRDLQTQHELTSEARLSQERTLEQAQQSLLNVSAEQEQVKQLSESAKEAMSTLQTQIKEMDALKAENEMLSRSLHELRATHEEMHQAQLSKEKELEESKSAVTKLTRELHEIQASKAPTEERLQKEGVLSAKKAEGQEVAIQTDSAPLLGSDKAVGTSDHHADEESALILAERQLKAQAEEIEKLKHAAVNQTSTEVPVENEETSLAWDDFVEAFKAKFKGTNSRGVKAMMHKMTVLSKQSDLQPADKKIQLQSFMHDEAKRLEDRWQSNISFYGLMRGRTAGVKQLYHMMARDVFNTQSADAALGQIQETITQTSLPLVHGRR